MKLNDSSRTKSVVGALLRGLEVRNEHLHASVLAALEKLGGAAGLYKQATTWEPIPTRKLALVAAGEEDALTAVKARQAQETDMEVKDALSQAVRHLTPKERSSSLIGR